MTLPVWLRAVCWCQLCKKTGSIGKKIINKKIAKVDKVIQTSSREKDDLGQFLWQPEVLLSMPDPAALGVGSVPAEVATAVAAKSPCTYEVLLIGRILDARVLTLPT